MKIAHEIDLGCDGLKRYFEKLFIVLKEESALTQIEYAKTTSYDLETKPELFPSFVNHVKPDMVLNMYGFFEFWIQEICEQHRRANNLKLSHRDIKGKSDLATYHKYLTEYLELDLSHVATNYQELDLMRKLRNRLIHNGGHAPADEAQRNEISRIEGIVVHVTLILIKDSYIWKSLENVRTYLKAALGPN